jgi:hypothetical protein
MDHHGSATKKDYLLKGAINQSQPDVDEGWSIYFTKGKRFWRAGNNTFVVFRKAISY